MSDEFIALIPARSGSKGIKNKNLLKIGKDSLIGWSIKSARSIDDVSKVVFSSDSNYYLNHAKKYKVDEVILRSAKASTDKATDNDYFEETIIYLEKKNIKFKYIVLLRPTTPLRNNAILNKAINFFIKNKDNFNSMRSVNQMSESAFKSFTVSKNRLYSIMGIKPDESNNSRHAFKNTFEGNGYIDIVKKNYFKKYGSLFGKKVLAFQTDFAYEIDNINDYDYAKFEFARNMKKYNSL